VLAAPSALSVKQRAFALAYVCNGGKAREAALEAGYGEAGAHVAANRCLVNHKVGAEIQRLCKAFIHTGLPAAIHRLIAIISDEKVAPRDAIKAVNSLLERGGLATEKGGVHVNVGVQVNGQEAQRLIGEVWNARSARLSDIPPAMSDTLEEDLNTIEALAIAPPTATPGGDQLQGPAGATGPLPVPSTATIEFPDVSQPDAASEFRRAFDEDDD
jgi:phage terminase small subunit